ncbi:hypothetical protein [Kribbella alba]|uniref:hypothetical protein n=1 Tax=Kribbella alba TaxID=190197 RepID=UPI0031DB5390
MSNSRQTIARSLAIFYALLWLLPGFAIIDLTVTWSSSWPVMLEAGWGLLFGALVAAPFVALARTPDSTPAILQLTVVCLLVAIAAALSLNWQAAAHAAVLAVQIASIVLARSARSWSGLGPPRRSVPLTVLAVLGFGPWIAYAFEMFAADRENRPDSDITNGVDHYSIQGALALALVALTALAAWWPRQFLLGAGGVAVAAMYLGIVSAAHQGTAGGFSTAWSWAAVLWGAGVGGAALLPHLDRARAVPGRP